jgi:hypothetical protein
MVGASGSNQTPKTTTGSFSFNASTGALTTTGPIYFTNYLYGTSKQVFDTTDSYLRLNQTNAFTSGIYTPYAFRADGATSLLSTLAVTGAITQGGNQVLHAGNYTSYSPSLTGGSASGTWSINVTGTAGSAPNASNANTYYNVTPGEGYGLKFWSSDNYKISMGSSSLYQYGPVNDYSIKTQMNDGDTGRGFTWGRISYAPIAAINSTSGNMQIAGTFISVSDIRSPIYYNYSDTSIYLASNDTPYTQWKIGGSKGSYGGIYDVYSGVSGIMYDSGGNGGVYRYGNARWYFYYNFSYDCMGIGTSTTSSTYSLYLNKGVYAQSRIDATIFYDTDNTGYYVDAASTSNVNQLQSARTYGFSDIRSPIFYDYDNTGYYVDAASTSKLNGLNVNSINTGNTINIGNNNNSESVATSSFRGLEFADTGGRDYYIGKDAGSWTQPLAIHFYTGIRIRSHKSYGGTQFYNIFSGNTPLHVNNGTDAVEVTTTLSSPIFYDYDNTNYYVDPASGSNMGTIYTNNWFRSYGGTGWYNQTYEGGIYMIDYTWVRVYNAKALYVANQIAATGDITAYYSDDRLKTKLSNIDNALSKVCSLSGFSYVENDVARSLGYNNNKQQIGVSAQQVQAILPEAVRLAPVDMYTDPETGEISSKSGENYLTVDYSRLVPLLIEAIKEQQKKIEELETFITRT